MINEDSSDALRGIASNSQCLIFILCHLVFEQMTFTGNSVF